MIVRLSVQRGPNRASIRLSSNIVYLMYGYRSTGKTGDAKYEKYNISSIFRLMFRMFHQN